MFLNNRPLVLLCLFLAVSPVDVIATIQEHNELLLDASAVEYYPEDDVEEDFEDLEELDEPFELFPNPLHILCPVCKLLQFIVGGLLSGLLGGNLLKQVLIFACSLITSLPLRIPFVPNILCTAIFELISMLTKGTKTGLCPLLLLCPMPKKCKNEKGKPVKCKKAPKGTKAPKGEKAPKGTKAPKAPKEKKGKKGATQAPVDVPEATEAAPAVFFQVEDSYEQRIFDIIENNDSANLSPSMEFFYYDLLEHLQIERLRGTGLEDQARHVLRNLVAAIDYHIAHRQEYLDTVAHKYDGYVPEGLFD